VVISKRLVAMKINLKSRVEWSGRKLTPAGNRGKAETPQAKPRRLRFLPAESNFLERNGTNLFLTITA
jgi:hypothetical protein